MSDQSRLERLDFVYLLMEIAGELNLALEDFLVDGHGVVVVERVDARQHLIGEDAERPPVHGLAVALVQEHFGGEVLRRATQRISARLAVLGETKVCELQVALLVDENILRLQISVNDVQRVEVLEHQRDLRGIEPNRVKGKWVSVSLHEIMAIKGSVFQKRGMFNIMSLVGGIKLPDHFFGIKWFITEPGRSGETLTWHALESICLLSSGR